MKIEKQKSMYVAEAEAFCKKKGMTEKDFAELREWWLNAERREIERLAPNTPVFLGKLKNGLFALGGIVLLGGYYGRFVGALGLPSYLLGVMTIEKEKKKR